MINKIKLFEIFVLRPLWVLLLGIAVVIVIKHLWFWLIGCVLGFFYLGVVGSKLHVLQSAADLSRGSLVNPASQVESELLTPDAVRVLIGHASTRVGIFIGVTMGVALWLIAGLQWYFAAPIALLTMMFSGALLKIAFRTQ